MDKPLDVNPIIVKELRSRMRGMRAFLTLTVSLLFMGLILYALYQVALASSQYSTSPISPQVGQILFTGLAFLLLFLIAAITPSITSGEISGERERQTYEMLMTTPLSPARILWGKLFASMGYVFLILFAAVPMASLIFIFGGINARDMIKALIALVVITVMFGVIGLFYSTLLNRSGRATVLTYLTIGLLLFGPIFAALLSGILKQQEPERWLMTPSSDYGARFHVSAFDQPRQHLQRILDAWKPDILDSRRRSDRSVQHPKTRLPLWAAALFAYHLDSLWVVDAAGATNPQVANPLVRSFTRLCFAVWFAGFGGYRLSGIDQSL
ncbi:MAG: ABC transporter permease [Anaerolineales bacterium]|nr:ABC transporter permease [Anaerolineales bacterium]